MERHWVVVLYAKDFHVIHGVYHSRAEAEAEEKRLEIAIEENDTVVWIGADRSFTHVWVEAIPPYWGEEDWERDG